MQRQQTRHPERSEGSIFMKQYFVYMLTNKTNSVLYIGITNDIIRRMYEHKNKLVPGFTAKYNLNKLVYYEIFDNSKAAIIREKELKGWKREKKNDLVESKNLEWNEIIIEE